MRRFPSRPSTFAEHPAVYIPNELQLFFAWHNTQSIIAFRLGIQIDAFHLCQVLYPQGGVFDVLCHQEINKDSVRSDGAFLKKFTGAENRIQPTDFIAGKTQKSHPIQPRQQFRNLRCYQTGIHPLVEIDVVSAANQPMQLFQSEIRRQDVVVHEYQFPTVGPYQLIPLAIGMNAA